MTYDDSSGVTPGPQHSQGVSDISRLERAKKNFRSARKNFRIVKGRISQFRDYRKQESRDRKINPLGLAAGAYPRTEEFNDLQQNDGLNLSNQQPIQEGIVPPGVSPATKDDRNGNNEASTDGVNDDYANKDIDATRAEGATAGDGSTESPQLSEADKSYEDSPEVRKAKNLKNNEPEENGAQSNNIAQRFKKIVRDISNRNKPYDPMDKDEMLAAAERRAGAKAGDPTNKHANNPAVSKANSIGRQQPQDKVAKGMSNKTGGLDKDVAKDVMAKVARGDLASAVRSGSAQLKTMALERLYDLSLEAVAYFGLGILAMEAVVFVGWLLGVKITRWKRWLVHGINLILFHILLGIIVIFVVILVDICKDLDGSYIAWVAFRILDIVSIFSDTAAAVAAFEATCQSFVQQTGS